MFMLLTIDLMVPRTPAIKNMDIKSLVHLLSTLIDIINACPMTASIGIGLLQPL